jgi:hypothetical protein
LQPTSAVPTPVDPNGATPQYLRVQSEITCLPPETTATPDSIEIQFNLQLSSEQKKCLSVPTFSPLTNFSIALSKLSVSENIYSSISDLVLSITEYFSSSVIQIGGRYLTTDADDIQLSIRQHFSPSSSPLLADNRRN